MRKDSRQKIVLADSLLSVRRMLVRHSCSNKQEDTLLVWTSQLEKVHAILIFSVSSVFPLKVPECWSHLRKPPPSLSPPSPTIQMVALWDSATPSTPLQPSLGQVSRCLLKLSGRLLNQNRNSEQLARNLPPRPRSLRNRVSESPPSPNLSDFAWPVSSESLGAPQGTVTPGEGDPRGRGGGPTQLRSKWDPPQRKRTERSYAWGGAAGLPGASGLHSPASPRLSRRSGVVPGAPQAPRATRLSVRGT